MKKYIVEVKYKSLEKDGGYIHTSMFYVEAETKQAAEAIGYSQWAALYRLSDLTMLSVEANLTNYIKPRKTAQEIANEKYKEESLGMGWFFVILIGALILTALVENI